MNVQQIQQPARYSPQPASVTGETFKVIGIALGALMIFFTLTSLIGQLLLLLFSQQVESSLDGVVANHSLLAGHIIGSAILIPVFYLIASASSARGRPVFLYFRPLRARHVLTAFKYFGFYMLPIILLYLLFAWMGMDFPTGVVEGSELTLPSEVFLVFVSTAIVAPIVEEIIFRGYFFAKLRRYHGFWVSFLISGSIFAFAHVGYPPLSLLFILIAAYFMSRSFEKTRNIWTPIIVHFLHNCLLVVLNYV